MSYKTVTYGSIEVYYTNDLHGGGMTLGQDFLARVSQTCGQVDRLFEWCAGPGFIGFSLLASGLCNSLCLADINPKAVEACLETVRRNGLEDRATVYLSDCLDNIPNSEKWDLVVGNPPHFGTSKVYPHLGPSTLYMDAGWKLHRRFYRDVGRFLAPNGQVIIQEHSRFSSPDLFRDMIEEGGLIYGGSLPFRIPSVIYYVWSTLS